MRLLSHSEKCSTWYNKEASAQQCIERKNTRLYPNRPLHSNYRWLLYIDLASVLLRAKCYTHVWATALIQDIEAIVDSKTCTRPILFFKNVLGTIHGWSVISLNVNCGSTLTSNTFFNCRTCSDYNLSRFPRGWQRIYWYFLTIGKLYVFIMPYKLSTTFSTGP